MSDDPVKCAKCIEMEAVIEKLRGALAHIGFSENLPCKTAKAKARRIYEETAFCDEEDDDNTSSNAP